MNNLTIVMYHYIRNIKESRYPGIKGLELEQFIEQMKFFNESYNIITMEDALDAEKGLSKLPEKSILLTFDDGYLEHFTLVYPILKKMGVQGSFFIPAKTVIEHKILDVNKIHFILSSLNEINDLVLSLKKEILFYKEEYSLLSFEHYFNQFSIPNRFDSKEIIFVKRMLQHVLPEKLRNILSDKFFEKYVGVQESIFASELYMNKYQIEHLVRDGMHVGCHGYDHYWWNKLNTNSLHQEINKSKDFLQSVGCDMSKWTACYPYGSFSDEVVEELKRQGCRLAFTTETKVANLDISSKYSLPRLDTNDFPPKSYNYVNYSEE